MSLGDLDDKAIAQFIIDVGGSAGDLVRLFADETRERVARMVSSDDLKNDAHSLKSTAGTYGMPGLAEAARRLETAYKDGDVTRTRELLGEIEAGLEPALAGLLERLDA